MRFNPAYDSSSFLNNIKYLIQSFPLASTSFRRYITVMSLGHIASHSSRHYLRRHDWHGNKSRVLSRTRSSWTIHRSRFVVRDMARQSTSSTTFFPYLQDFCTFRYVCWYLRHCRQTHESRSVSLTNLRYTGICDETITLTSFCFWSTDDLEERT